MEHTTSHIPSGRATTAWICTAVLLVAFWLLIFNQQRLEWSVNVVYSYGWAVPALAFYLLWERWRTRPVAGALPPLWIVLVAAAMLLTAYLPVRVIQEANPDWVKINWMMAALPAGLTLLAIAAAGGVRQAVHCAFPILFCFTALPWPVWMETYLLQELMRWNAAIGAEVLTACGTPALATGNVIEIATRRLNVEEACSGIRSLQTAFMMALFLGEFHRLALWRRAALLLASFAVAFVLNIARTVLLSYLGVEEGGVDRWHDTVGLVVMGLCLVALWGVAELFHRREATGATVPKSGETAPAASRVPFPAAFALAGVAWLGIVEFLTGSWYSFHERRLPPPVAWHVTLPSAAPQFFLGDFAERTQALLKYNSGVTASWRSEGGQSWQMYHLSWLPGRVSKFLSISHYPTVCLPATGLSLVAELGLWECRVNGLIIPFATYRFQGQGGDVYVFHAIIEDRPLRPGEQLHYRQVDSSERLASVWRGERNLGQHVIGISLRGSVSELDARELIERELENIIRPGPAQ